MSIFAVDLNSSADRCEAAPVPEEPKVSLPGLARAKVMSSFMDEKELFAAAVTTYGDADTSVTGANWWTFFSVSEAVELIRRVLPSAGDLATKSAPMWPLAPGLFSTITCSFHSSVSFGAIRRARASAPPPGGKGTMMRVCETALPERRRRARRRNFMGPTLRPLKNQ